MTKHSLVLSALLLFTTPIQANRLGCIGTGLITLGFLGEVATLFGVGFGCKQDKKYCERLFTEIELGFLIVSVAGLFFVWKSLAQPDPDYWPRDSLISTGITTPENID